jgi:hypothetical protein
MTMRASLVLCDFAESDSGSGKVHILGAGWVATGPGPSPHAVVAFISVPPERAEAPLQVLLRLTDKSGQVLEVPGPGGMQRLEISGQVELRQLPDWDRTTPLSAVFPLNLNTIILPLVPGQAYTWWLEVDGKEMASADFYVRSAPPTEPAAKA